MDCRVKPGNDGGEECGRVTETRGGAAGAAGTTGAVDCSAGASSGDA